MLEEQKSLRGLKRCKIIQNDSGANRCITNDKAVLLKFKHIPSIPIGGIQKNSPALFATGNGLLPFRSDNGDILLVPCLYCEHAECTLLSPTAIVTHYHDIYYGWSMHGNQDTGVGYLALLNRDGINHTKFGTFKENDLWFHYAHDTPSNADKPIIHRLSQRAAFEVWHHRLGHVNPSTVEQMHKYAIGVPKLRSNSLYKCATCLACKMKKASHSPTKSIPKSLPIPTEQLHPGQHLHMDFGFVRGSDWSSTNGEGKLITSIDGFRSYLIIVDRATRYKWIFLTTTKAPPLKEVASILTKFKPTLVHLHCTVRSDQGGELGKSTRFRKLVEENGWTFEPTGSQSSAQNGLAEKPNQDLKNSCQCLLHAAGLGSQYWSYALNHAVYLANRLLHRSISMTPFQALHKRPPNLSHLRVFGSRCYFKNTKKNQKNMDISTGNGVFLGYTASDKNIYVLNNATNKILVASHISFDEAHMTSPTEQQPPMSQAMIQAGYKNDISNENDSTIDPNNAGLRVQLLSKDGITPTRSTPESAGLDVYSTESVVIEPHSYTTIPLDIAIQAQPGTYAQIQERSSFAIKGLTIAGGIIDSDYRGNITVIPINNSDQPITITKGQKFAQLILKRIWVPSVEVVEHLDASIRGKKGFGSSDKEPLTAPQHKIPEDKFPTSVPPAAAAAKATVKDTIEFTDNPFDHQLDITIEKSGNHPTLGLDMTMCELRQQPKLLACQKGEPAGKIRKWKSTLRDGYILAVNGIPTTTVQEVRKCIADVSTSHVTVTFGTISKPALHPQNGVPQLYFDQLYQIGRHLFHLKTDPDWILPSDNDTTAPDSANYQNCANDDNEKEGSIAINRARVKYKSAILPKGRRRGVKLTRRKLQKQEDWHDWETSERKQLNQYEAQDTFGSPCLPPPNANILPLLWTYTIKADGTKKARCVCNGAPSKKGSVTLGATYAGSLDQTGSRIFWATAALKNLKVYGADVSNAFAEAPPPKAPLYVTIDKPFADWWKSKGRPPIASGHVLPVKRALQGHPESPRLWAELINGILVNEMKLKPTTHEPCLYKGIFQEKEIFFLRQVDDFAIACDNEQIAKSFIEEINKKLSIDIKYLGLVRRFNGVDVDQMADHIKLHCTTYINKILNEHEWFDDELPCHTFPIPMKAENSYSRNLELAQPPNTQQEKYKLEKVFALQLPSSHRRAHIRYGHMPPRHIFSFNKIESVLVQSCSGTLYRC